MVVSETFFTIPKLLATEISEAVATTLGGVLNRVCVVPGAIAWDECDCGALYVSVGRWFLSETFPASLGADSRNTPCELPWLVGDITIQIMRCAPQPEGRTAIAPTCAALETAARINAVDAYTVMMTTLSVLCGLKNDDTIIDFNLGEQTASGPGGACVGSELHAFIAVPR